MNSIGAIQYDATVVTLQGRIFGVAARMAAGAMLVVVAGCGSDDAAPPMATVSMTLSKAAAALGSPIDMRYRFEVAPGATFDGNTDRE